jgi:hypothetical protein
MEPAKAFGACSITQGDMDGLGVDKAAVALKLMMVNDRQNNVRTISTALMRAVTSSPAAEIPSICK